MHSLNGELHVAMCRELPEENSVTCSYHDNFAPLHNQMNVIHRIVVKYIQTIYFYNVGSARKIDAKLNILIYRMSQTSFWVEKLIFGLKKVEKLLDTHILL